MAVMTLAEIRREAKKLRGWIKTAQERLGALESAELKITEEAERLEWVCSMPGPVPEKFPAGFIASDHTHTDGSRHPGQRIGIAKMILGDVDA